MAEFDSEFDDLFDDLEIKGTHSHVLPGVFVHSDKPFALVMKHAGDGNPAYKSMRTKIIAEQRAVAGEDEKVRALNIRLYAHTVFVGWKNANKKDGTPLPYSPAIAIALLQRIADKGGSDKVGAAFIAASDPDNFRGSSVAATETLGK